MARFHSTMVNSRGNTISSVQHSACIVRAEGWHGAIRVRLSRDGDQDRYLVELLPHSAWGDHPAYTLARGVLDHAAHGEE